MKRANQAAAFVAGLTMLATVLPVSGQGLSLEDRTKIRNTAYNLSRFNQATYIGYTLTDGSTKVALETFSTPVEDCSKVAYPETCENFETGLTAEQKNKAIVMAQLDAAAYKDRAGQYPPSYEPVTGADLESLVDPGYFKTGAVKQDGVIEFGGGFAARIFRNKEDGNLVVAFRGSESSNPGDFLTDWIETDMGQLMGDDTRQYQAAQKLLGDVIRNTEGKKNADGQEIHIDVTGHSLGGGLANWAMASNPIGDRVKGWTLNAAGLSEETLARTRPELIKQAAANTVNIRNEYDVVSMAGNHVGPLYTVRNEGDMGDAVAAHDITVGIQNMLRTRMYDGAEMREQEGWRNAKVKPIEEELQPILLKYSRAAAEAIQSLTPGGRVLVAVMRRLEDYVRERAERERAKDAEEFDYKAALAPKRIEGREWWGTRSKRETLYNNIWDIAEGYSHPPPPCRCPDEAARQQAAWKAAYDDFKKKQGDAYWALRLIRDEGWLRRLKTTDTLLNYVPVLGDTYGLVRLAEEAPGLYAEVMDILQSDEYRTSLEDAHQAVELANTVESGCETTWKTLGSIADKVGGIQRENLKHELKIEAGKRADIEKYIAGREELIKKVEAAIAGNKMVLSTQPGWTGSNPDLDQLEKELTALKRRVAAENDNIWKSFNRAAEARSNFNKKIMPKLSRVMGKSARLTLKDLMPSGLDIILLGYELNRDDEGSIWKNHSDQYWQEFNYEMEEEAALIEACNALCDAYNAGCDCPEETEEDADEDDPSADKGTELPQDDETDEAEFRREHPILTWIFDNLPDLIDIIVDNWPDFDPQPRPGPDTEYDPDIHTDTQTQQQEQQQGYEYWPGDSTNGTYGVYTNATYETTDVSTNGTYEATDVSTNGTTSVSTNAAGPVQGDEPSKPQEEKGPEGEESPIEQALALMIDAGLGEGETVLEMEQVLHDLIEGNYEGEGEPSVEEILKMAEEGGLFGDWTGGEEGTDGGCFDGPEGPSIGGCFGGDAQGGGDVWGPIKTTTVQKLESWATKQLDSWIAKNPELQKWFGILGIDGKWIVGGVKEIWGILTGNGSLSDKIGNLAEWAQNKLCDMAVSALNYGLDKLQHWLSGIAQKWIGKAVNWLKNLLGEHGIKIPDKLLGKFQAALEKLVGKGIGKVVDIGRDAGERIINRMRPSQGGGSNGTQILQMGGGGGGGTGNRKP